MYLSMHSRGGERPISPIINPGSKGAPVGKGSFLDWHRPSHSDGKSRVESPTAIQLQAVWLVDGALHLQKSLQMIHVDQTIFSAVFSRNQKPAAAVTVAAAAVTVAAAAAAAAMIAPVTAAAAAVMVAPVTVTLAPAAVIAMVAPATVTRTPTTMTKSRLKRNKPRAKWKQKQEKIRQRQATKLQISLIQQPRWRPAQQHPNRMTRLARQKQTLIKLQKQPRIPRPHLAAAAGVTAAAVVVAAVIAAAIVTECMDEKGHVCNYPSQLLCNILQNDHDKALLFRQYSCKFASLPVQGGADVCDNLSQNQHFNLSNSM